MDRHLVLRGDNTSAASLICRSTEGDAALLYLYLCAHSGRSMLGDAAKELKLSSPRAKKAADVLLMYGIAANEGTVFPRPPAPAHPSELAQKRDGDPEFSGLCSYWEGAQGMPLSINQLQTLNTVHYELNLPCEVLMLMINYCRTRRRLNMREMERLSYEWCDKGINTYDLALAHIEELKEKQSRVGKIMSLFGLYSRRASDSERAYIEKWIQMGFDDDLIKLAYERTVARIHEVNFDYINGILTRWHAAGITTMEKAEEEKQRRAKPKAYSSVSDDEAIEAAVLAQFEKKRRNRELTQQKRLEELLKSSAEFAAVERQMRLCASQAARSSGERKESLTLEKNRLQIKRGEILESLGYSKDWLDNTPDCPLCQDRGFIGTKKCECLIKAVQDMKK